MKAPLNLATRPVRNERLPGLLFAIAAFAMFLVTLQHAGIVYRLLPARSKALRAEVAELRKEAETLDNEKSRLARLTATAQEKTEWAVIKSLVDRRTFWWSKLFELLERALPRAVKVVNVVPRVKDTRYFLDMTLRSETVEDGYAFCKDLERRDEFSEVTINEVSRNTAANSREDEAEFRVTMRYLMAAYDSKPSGPAAAALAPGGSAPGPAARPSPTRATAVAPKLEGTAERDAQVEPEPEGTEAPEAPEPETPQ